MRLVSTRDPHDQASFAEAIQLGMAPGGGLYAPVAVPVFPEVEALLELDLQDRSVLIIQRLLGDEFTAAELEEAVRDTLSFPVPLVPVGERLLALELFHGPTLAFKDFGARFLARMLALVARREGGGPRTVLTATSGDTGAAVAHAFQGMAGFRVVVLYPRGRVSVLQEKQFATLGEPVRSFAVEGSFDDCQALVKACFQDGALSKRLLLTSANSINIARLLGQVLYYFEAVAQARRLGFRQAPVVAVPSGNFGNLYAGLLAQRTGLGVKAFVVATNANRTVPEYLDTGSYRPRPSVATLSSAMDVGTPSNWERVQALYQGDLEALRANLRWGSRTDAETLETVARLQAVGYVPDPHGAVACGVLEAKLEPGEVGIFLATAHPAKFQDLREGDPGLPAALAEVLGRPVLSRPLPVDLEALKAGLTAPA
jgi:threonine synthase